MSLLEIEKIIDEIKVEASSNLVPFDDVYKFCVVIRETLLTNSVRFIKSNEKSITCHFDQKINDNFPLIPKRHVLVYETHGWFNGNHLEFHSIGNGDCRNNQEIKIIENSIRNLK